MLLLKQTPRRENHRRKIYEHKLISLLFDRVSFFLIPFRLIRMNKRIIKFHMNLKVRDKICICNVSIPAQWIISK